jgi:hypothetical protein
MIEKCDSCLSQIRAGKLQLKELTQESVEEVVFEVISEQVISSESLSSIVVKRNRRDPIDIIIEVLPSEALTGILQETESRLIYVECKYHNKKVELDWIAKVFCMAIRDMPNQLVLVSDCGIASQAKDYASYFFRTERSRGIFPSIVYREVSLSSLLGLNSGEVAREEANSLAIEEAIHCDWEVLEKSTFGRAYRRSSSSTSQPVDIFDENHYTIKVTSPILREKLECVTLALGNQTIDLSSTQELEVDGLPLVTSLLKLPEGASGCEDPQLEIRLRDGKLVAIKLPPIRQAPRINILPDLRRELTEAFYSTINGNGLPILLFVSGEAGVGKSKFVEALCSKFSREQGVLCFRFSASEESTESLFVNMALALICERDVASEWSKTTAQELLAAYLGKVSGRVTESSGDRRTASSFKFDLELITYFIASTVRDSLATYCFAIRDCERLSPLCATGLELLAAALENIDAKNFILIFEYRTGEQYSGVSSARNLKEIRDRYHAMASSVEIGKLTVAEIAVGLQNITGQIDSEVIAQALFRKSGGNALFIKHLFLEFIRSGTLRYSAVSKVFYISDANALSRELAIIPSGVVQFLEYRFDQILDRMRRGALPVPNSKIDLGFLSLCLALGHSFRVSDLNRFLPAVGEDAVGDSIQFFIANGVFAYRGSTDVFGFSHELMYLAAQSFAIRRRLTSLNLLKSVERNADRNSIDDAATCGKLNILANNPLSSFDHFNRGWEIAKVQGSFSARLKCLVGCKSALESLSPDTIHDWPRKRLAVERELCWSEIQAGSQQSALEGIKCALELSSRAGVVYSLHQSELDLWIEEFVYQELLLLSRLMRVDDFCRSFVLNYSRVTSPKGKLHSLSRLLLLASLANYPSVAWKAVMASLPVLHPFLQAYFRDRQKSNLVSDFFSDLGRLFLQCHPEVTVELWRRGAETSETRRQTTHSELNCLVSKTIAFPESVNLEEIIGLKEEIHKLGVVNQLIRCLLVEGIYLFRHQGHGKAMDSFWLALRKAIESNQIFWQWKCHLNIATVLLCGGKVAEAREHTQKAVALLEPVLIHDKQRMLLVGELDCFGFGSTDVYVSSLMHLGIPAIGPAWSGLFKLAILNGQLIPGLESELHHYEAGRIPERFSGNSLLDVEAKVGQVYFAIE